MKLYRSLLVLLSVALALRADEGMWTFDNLPLATIKAKYNFVPDEKWLEHVRLASLDFGNGSGSFVSKDGLVLTNHHVGLKALEKVSVPGTDYAKQGFIAKTRADEIKIPDFVLCTLTQTINVTDKVNAAVKPGMNEQQAMQARSEKAAKLRDDFERGSKFWVDYVSLYQGGEYWLYVYTIHKDVRLVMAPEEQIAFFGGDPDNFTFPRHDLDFCLFRVYEGGVPYHPEHYLSWSREGIAAGALTFVVGCPGSTNRFDTIAQMKYQRDSFFPREIGLEEAHRDALKEYGKVSPDNARKVFTQIFSIENSLKADRGELGGLLDSKAFEALESKERELREAVAKDPKLAEEVGESWARIEAALEDMKPLDQVIALANSRNSKMLKAALNTVRCSVELDKPKGERLDGYRTDNDVDLAKWRVQRSQVFDDPDLETFLIAKGLEDIQKLDPEHPFRKAVLGDRSAAEIAKEAVSGTKIQMNYVRTELVQHGIKGLNKTTDPLFKLAYAIERLRRDLEQKRENLQSVIDEYNGRIARARFALYGKALYPDATSSMRLTFGRILGYQDQNVDVKPFTTFADLYDRAQQKGPDAASGAWALPAKWTERKGAIDLNIPLNFCSDADIIGGNSGSPVINTKGEFVGVIFDGNLQSLPGRFYFDPRVNRAVSLDARAIIEALIKVYDAKAIAAELLPQ